jgi:hypothetical protein
VTSPDLGYTLRPLRLRSTCSYRERTGILSSRTMTDYGAEQPTAARITVGFDPASSSRASMPAVGSTPDIRSRAGISGRSDPAGLSTVVMRRRGTK